MSYTWLNGGSWHQNEVKIRPYKSWSRKKTRGWESLFAAGYELYWDQPVSLVWCEGEQWFNSVGKSINGGYIKCWLIWVKNKDVLSTLEHDLIVHRVCTGFAQGLRRVWVPPFYSLINCCRTQGRSREVLPEVLQNNWKTSHTNPTTKVSLFCVFLT